MKFVSLGLAILLGFSVFLWGETRDLSLFSKASSYCQYIQPNQVPHPQCTTHVFQGLKFFDLYWLD